MGICHLSFFERGDTQNHLEQTLSKCENVSFLPTVRKLVVDFRGIVGWGTSFKPSENAVL